MAHSTVNTEGRVQSPIATPKHDVVVVRISTLRELPDGTYKYYTGSLEESLAMFIEKYGSPSGHIYIFEITSPKLRHVYFPI